MLFNEPKLLKCCGTPRRRRRETVSVLFNEPKLLKSKRRRRACGRIVSFSALQRAEIAEIGDDVPTRTENGARFSALQRAEIAEIETLNVDDAARPRFSALQRAEIAEIKH